MTVRTLPAGDAAVLVELDGLEQVLDLYAALRRDPPEGTVDLVPAARTVLVVFDPTATTADRVAAALRRPREGGAPRGEAPLVEVPVRYDGPDLAEVAALTGLAPREVVQRHRDAAYVVAFCGFAPGFAYLTGGDPALEVPRRSSPRTGVPPGAVGLAGPFTAVYPRRSPGGWQLIGRTDLPVWDVGADPPALLRPGVRVRFVEEHP